MSRISRLAPHELDEEQRRLYAAITAGDRARGPQFFELTDHEGRLEGRVRVGSRSTSGSRCARSWPRPRPSRSDARWTKPCDGPSPPP